MLYQYSFLHSFPSNLLKYFFLFTNDNLKKNKCILINRTIFPSIWETNALHFIDIHTIYFNSQMFVQWHLLHSNNLRLIFTHVMQINFNPIVASFHFQINACSKALFAFALSSDLDFIELKLFLLCV